MVARALGPRRAVADVEGTADARGHRRRFDLRPACEVLEAIRREKSSAKVSQRAEVASVTVRAPAEFLAAIAVCEEDLKAAGGVATLLTREETELFGRGSSRRRLIRRVRQTQCGVAFVRRDVRVRDL